MARAKRTDRAEARRRHRAATAPLDVEMEGGVESTSTAASTGRASSSSPAMSTPGGRVGMGTAFRLAFHPVDLRADLASLPWLAVRSPALWVPALLTIVSGIIVWSVGVNGALTQLVYQFFVMPPALGGVFLAGFLAPRASWLLGLIIGTLSAIVYSVLVVFAPLSIFTVAPDAAVARDLVLSAFLLSPAFGAIFAAGAAWYRRFLQLSSPNRGRRAEARKKSNDGKSRTPGRDQNAGARR